MIENKEKKKLFIVFLVLVLVGFPLFSILDLIYYPEYIRYLLTIRIVVVVYALCTFLLLSKISIKYIDADILGIPGNFAISLMCYFTGGFSSTYFGGNMLVILAASMLMVNFIRYAVSLVVILTFHFSLLMLHQPFDLQGMSVHAFFLGYAAVIGFITNLLIDKIRNREFIANQKNEYFIKVFAHDIKNRLTVGIATLQACAHGADKECVQGVMNNEEEMNRMVINLINLFSEDQIAINKEEINSAVLIDTFNTHWAAAFRSKNIEFVCLSHGNNNLWLDKNYMFLVFDNLLSNAFQYTPHNGKVTVELSRDGAFSYISFINSGETISKKIVEDMFKQYLSPEKQTAYHKGLGLNYSKMMCKLHGGNLTYDVENNMNKFMVKIPLHKSA